MKAWVPYPRYLFRKEIAMSLIRKHVPTGSKFLEIGCASGDFGVTLAKRGYSGLMLDFSDQAAAHTMNRLAAERVSSVRFLKQRFEDLHTEDKFDFVTMFEVLEHIQDDAGALEKAGELLRTRGFLLLSVPAKMQLWGAHDVIAGHVRRYDKKDLKRVVQDAGFDIERFVCYGFPWLNGIRYVREKLAAKALRRGPSGDRLERTKESGLNPDATTVPRLECLFRRHLLLPFIWTSCLFNGLDLAEGYLCLARKHPVRKRDGSDT
jgi:SAM-dependent methyltransferase